MIPANPEEVRAIAEKIKVTNAADMGEIPAGSIRALARAYLALTSRQPATSAVLTAEQVRAVESAKAVHAAAEKERLYQEEMYGSPRHQTVAAGAHFNRGQLLGVIDALLSSAPVAAQTQAERELAKEERAHETTILQRDDAESALGEAYFIVTGEHPQWSSKFRSGEALEDIRRYITEFKASTPQAAGKMPTREQIEAAVYKFTSGTEVAGLPIVEAITQLLHGDKTPTTPEPRP